MSKTLVVFLLFNLTFFTIHPDLNRQYGDFSRHVKNAIFALKAPYQVKKIDSARDRNHPLHINGLEVLPASTLLRRLCIELETLVNAPEISVAICAEPDIK